MAFVIQHLTLPGPAYYGGPSSGWVTDINLGVQYAASVDAQSTINIFDMYATVKTNPLSNNIIPDFVTKTLQLATQFPATRTASWSGTGMDFTTGNGPCCAVQIVGAVSGTLPTMDTRLQESPDGAGWANITGANFAQVIASSDLQRIQFTRTQPFLRVFSVVAGTLPSFPVAVILWQSNVGP